jgi:hypothetical protein
MMSQRRRPLACILGLFVGVLILGSLALLLHRPQWSGAQTVSTPITRHVVLYWAKQYTTYPYRYPTSAPPVTSVPYAHKADWINSALGQGPDSCAAEAALFQHRLDRGCYTGCNSQAGADCSGYVMRVWGVALDQPKWDTSAIAAHSTVVPCRAGQEQCIQQATRNEDLPKRMRMGDVFDDTGCHVVLLYYFDPNTVPPTPYYYEENGDPSVCRARLHSGWAYIDDTCAGWWDGADGYRPYRYNEIRDDMYFPWLCNNWSNWSSILYLRDNTAAGSSRVLQHTVYSYAGGDAYAQDNRTIVKTSGNDSWEVATSGLAPAGYVGGGVAAADTGTGALVNITGYNMSLAYTGIYPFSDLGMKSANTLYMPAFSYYYQVGNSTYISKIFVQNAGKVATAVANVLNDNLLDGGSSYSALEKKASSVLGLPGEEVPTQ